MIGHLALLDDVLRAAADAVHGDDLVADMDAPLRVQGVPILDEAGLDGLQAQGLAVAVVDAHAEAGALGPVHDDLELHGRAAEAEGGVRGRGRGRMAAATHGPHRQDIGPPALRDEGVDVAPDVVHLEDRVARAQRPAGVGVVPAAHDAGAHDVDDERHAVPAVHVDAEAAASLVEHGVDDVDAGRLLRRKQAVAKGRIAGLARGAAG
mmetsp:Transcript_54920/g.154039  ORF Transcript_54920/g.154039 Transcript_54920/m.154039 type:complete len:208 (-) Transcript_54920:159-782(-)